MSPLSRRRAAAGSQYALIVGLVGVVALAATAGIGLRTSSLFGTVSNRMTNVSGSGAVSGGSAAPDPSQQCANGTTPLARAYRTGGQEYWLCMGNRSTALPPSALTTCPTTGWVGTSFPAFDGSTNYGAMRFEVTNVTTVLSTTTTNVSPYTCFDAACTSSSGGGGTSSNVTRSYADNIDSCAVSLDNYSIATGTTAYVWYQNGGVNNVDYTFAALGTIGVRQWSPRPMGSFYYLRGQNNLTFAQVNLVTNKV